MANIGDCDVG